MTEERLAAWRRLGREEAWQATREDPVAAAAVKARWKVLHKAARRRAKEKGEA